MYSIESRDRISWRQGHERLAIIAVSRDTARVICGQFHLDMDLPNALEDGAAGDAGFDIETTGETLVATNGNLRIEGDARGYFSFFETSSGKQLLAEAAGHSWWPGPRYFSAAGNGLYRIEQRFAAHSDEKFFGLGQRTHGKLDQKGMVLELLQRNAEVSIPFTLSNRGYGFLWNNPAVGRVELAANGTRWVSDAARQIDYVVMAGTPREILRSYADLTGHVPMLPEWASGFWQSKLRYRTQDELMAVAREHHRRGLPMSVIVADFFHWTHVGEFRFDPAEFPDPKAMVDELESYGVKLMVSIWPTVSPIADVYQEMRDKGLLIATERGVPFITEWRDKGLPRRLPVNLYDSTNPEAREHVWRRVAANYKSLGIKVWWLDACEPEIQPNDPGNMRLWAGLGSEVLNLYPRSHAQGFYEGMRAEGEEEVVLLCRSAWAGSQRYGAAVWSGDIATTFESLAAQVRAGMSIGISGIPWWTTDIGGFYGGDPDSAEYRELMIRWFQFGTFCPLFRLHGHRDPRGADNESNRLQEWLGPEGFGAANEVWSYGEDVYEILRDYLFIRERIRPYIMSVMSEASAEGIPAMRALFVEFPHDEAAWQIEDQFMLGGELLVAPVTERGVRSKDVYLPAGTTWRDAWTGALYEGGRRHSIDAPLGRIPLFIREGSALSIMEND